MTATLYGYYMEPEAILTVFVVISGIVGTLIGILVEYYLHEKRSKNGFSKPYTMKFNLTSMSLKRQ